MNYEDEPYYKHCEAMQLTDRLQFLDNLHEEDPLNNSWASLYYDIVNKFGPIYGDNLFYVIGYKDVIKLDFFLSLFDKARKKIAESKWTQLLKFASDSETEEYFRSHSWDYILETVRRLEKSEIDNIREIMNEDQS